MVYAIRSKSDVFKKFLKWIFMAEKKFKVPEIITVEKWWRISVGRDENIFCQKSYCTAPDGTGK